MSVAATAALLLTLASAPPLRTLPAVGEEVDVTAGVATALSCAIRARDHGELGALTGCPPAEAQKHIVVYDVAEQQIYLLTGKGAYRYLLEGAFGGGSVDFTGKVSRVDRRTGVVTIRIEEMTATPKPKAGGFKGCL